MRKTELHDYQSHGNMKASDFLSNEFQEHLSNEGIEIELTVHDTSSDNGVAKQGNCIWLEKTRTFLLTAKLLTYLWAEVLLHVIWLKNCTSTKSLPGKTPFEVIC